MKLRILAGIFLLAVLAAGVFAETQSTGLSVGAAASDWKVSDWINSEALELKDLKGKVVLVRWWTAPGCPFCIASAPALNEFYGTYHGRGLEVIGFYHHKAAERFDKNTVKRYADNFGFKFPVAVDYDWVTLKEWWLTDPSREWTSVSFLIDKKGIIRYIHSGGQYVKGDGDYQKIREMIEELLKEH